MVECSISKQAHLMKVKPFRYWTKVENGRKYFEDLQLKSPKSRNSRGHWIVQENYLTFMEQLAKRFNIKKPSDWGTLSRRKLIQNGASSLLEKGSSLLNVLQRLYPSKG